VRGLSLGDIAAFLAAGMRQHLEHSAIWAWVHRLTPFTARQFWVFIESARDAFLESSSQTCCCKPWSIEMTGLRSALAAQLSERTFHYSTMRTRDIFPRHGNIIPCIC
jgi:hypothetical protein